MLLLIIPIPPIPISNPALFHTPRTPRCSPRHFGNAPPTVASQRHCGHRTHTFTFDPQIPSGTTYRLAPYPRTPPPIPHHQIAAAAPKTARRPLPSQIATDDASERGPYSSSSAPRHHHLARTQHNMAAADVHQNQEALPLALVIGGTGKAHHRSRRPSTDSIH